MAGTGGFQTQIYDQPALGVAGNYPDGNPRFYYDAGPGGLVAGASGVIVGRFAWTAPPLDPNNAPTIVNNFGFGNVAGFVPLNQQALNTTYLSAFGNTIQPGFPMALLTGGSVLAVNSGASQIFRGMKAYATLTTGLVTFAATGSPTTASATSSSIATGTAATFTGVINGDILTASSVSNTIYAGAVVTGGTVATSTTILSQISGTAGGAGTYYVDIPEQTVASASLTATPYVLDTTGGTVTGTVGIGSVLATAGGTATGTVVGMSVASVYNATSGKWVMARAPLVAAGTVTSGTITLASNVETDWYALNSALAGEIVKMASPQGFSSKLS